MSDGSSTRSKTSSILDDTFVYVIVGRQRRFRRGNAERLLQRAHRVERPGRTGNGRLHDFADRRLRDGRKPTTITPSAGRTRWTRRTSGRSRSPRTGAARATARSSTGPRRSSRRAKCGRSSITSSTSPPPSWTWPAYPNRRSVHGIQQMPLHGVSMAPSFDDAAAPEQRETQYFEMFCNRGIYHKGWTAVTRHCDPLGHD